MARYNPTITVKEALGTYMNNPAFQEATGKLVINSSTSKRNGAVFLYKGKVYAIQVKGYSGRLFTRVVNSGLLPEEAVYEVQRKYGRDQDNPAIIDYAAQKMLITAEQAGEFIREYSLGAWDDLFSWVGVKIEWRNGATTDTTTFSTRPVSLEKLVDLGERRAKFLEEIAGAYTVSVDDLPTLTYRKIDPNYTARGLEGDVLAYASGEYTVSDLVRLTGVPAFNLAVTVYELWETDRLEVWYGEFRLVRKEIEQMQTDTSTYGTAQPIIRADFVEEDAEVADASGEEAVAAAVDESQQLAQPAEPKVAPQQVENPQLDEDQITPEPEAEDEATSNLEGVELDEDDSDEVAEEEPAMADFTPEEPAAPAAAELDFIPLAEDEEDEREQAAPVAPANLGAGADDDLIGSFLAQARQRLEGLRGSAQEAADHMRECDEAIVSDAQSIAEWREALGALQQNILAAEGRVRQNEEAREQWEAVYDEATEKYHAFQTQLSSLNNIS